MQQDDDVLTGYCSDCGRRFRMSDLFCKNVPVADPGYSQLCEECFTKEPTADDASQCTHGDAVHWNPYNQVVQCHQCGTIFYPEIDQEIDRERLGKLVRSEWIEWAMEQPDIAEHPHWLTPWQDLSERDKEVDRRIGETVARDVLHMDDDERKDSNRARIKGTYMMRNGAAGDRRAE